MTVNANIVTANRAFDGVTTAFPLGTMEYSAASDLVATFIDATGAGTTKVLGDDFTITGASGAATINVALPKQLGYVSVRVDRSTAIRQDVPFVPGTGAPAAAQEKLLDRLTFALQEAAAKFGRALLVPPGQSAPAYADFAQTFRGDRGPTGGISNANFVYLNLDPNIANDNYLTIQTAINAMALTGGEIALPSGWFRVSQRLTVPRTVFLHGVGSGTRARVYGEPVVVNPWESYTGTVLVFDQNVGGLFLPTFTDVLDPNTVVANAGSAGSNPTYWQYGGALGARVEGMVLYSRGYTGTPTGLIHGIEVRTIVSLRDLIVYGFPGHGVYITASADVSDGASKYGLADRSLLTNVNSTYSLVCGFRIEGRDANVMKIDTCTASFSGSWGFDDAGALGNTYISCHTTNNNQNAFIANHSDVRYVSMKADANTLIGSFRATSTAAPHSYLGCYVEGASGALTSLTSLCLVVGGIMAGTGDKVPGTPVTMYGGLLQNSKLQHYNARGSVAVSVGFGDSTNRMTVLGWGSLDVSAGLGVGAFSQELTYYPTPKMWSIEQPSASATGQVAFPTALSDAYSAPYFQNGFYFGSPNTSVNRRVTFVAGTSSPPNGFYGANDIVYMNAVAGSKAGWLCTAAGAKASAWASGQTYSPNGWRNLVSIVSNAGNVYRCTTQGGGTTSVAPVHGAGTVTGADGYAWQWLNATTVPTFARFGDIELAGSATYDPPSIAAAGTTTTTVTVTGAAVGDFAVASFGNALAGLMLGCEISSANTATVRLFNPTGGAVDLASGTLSVRVFKQ